MIKILHHTDPDGYCAGFWVRTYAQEKCEPYECIAMDYDKPTPFDRIAPGDEVWIVDFSIPVTDMDKLLSITPNVVWCDHHKTSIEKYKDYPITIEGLRVDGIAGCELTCIYSKIKRLEGFKCYGSLPIILSPKTHSYKDYVPYFTQLIGDRDVWKWEYGEETEFFYLGLQMFDMNPESNVWDMLINSEYHLNLIESGKVIKKYRDSWAKEYVDKFGFPVTFEGYRCYAVNIGKSGTEFFGEKVKEYDILIPFIYTKDGNWTFSLYSVNENVDCSELAKKYGGGGHRGAAGFLAKTLPFKREI